MFENSIYHHHFHNICLDAILVSAHRNKSRWVVECRPRPHMPRHSGVGILNMPVTQEHNRFGLLVVCFSRSRFRELMPPRPLSWLRYPRLSGLVVVTWQCSPHTNGITHRPGISFRRSLGAQKCLRIPPPYRPRHLALAVCSTPSTSKMSSPKVRKHATHR